MSFFPLSPDAAEWGGVRYHTLLGPSDSGGAMSIVDTLSPVNASPPRHVHDKEDEIFVLLSGVCEFWADGEMFTRSAGETVFVPRGVEHTYRVIGDKPCRHLVILTPGGFEGFFYDMARQQCRIPEDMAAIEQSAARFNLRFTGPPLGN
jgi:quercetin dioxygenase-like cupin family protein